MKRFLKYGIVPAIVFWALLTITVMVLPVLINVAQFVPFIEKRISAVTGHQVAIGDDLSVAFFPWLSLSFSDLRLANPPGFGNSDFLTADTVEAEIAILPLLKKQIRFTRLVIAGLDMELEVNAAGQRNWQGGDGDHRAWEEVLGGLLTRIVEQDCLFVVTHGTIHRRDGTGEENHSLRDLMLLINRTNKDNDTRELEFRATLADQSFSAAGAIGTAAEPAQELPITLDVSFGEGIQGRLQGKMALSFLHPAFSIEAAFAKVHMAELLALMPTDQLWPRRFFLPDMKLTFTTSMADGLLTIKDGTALFAEDQQVLFSGVRRGGDQAKVEFEAQSKMLQLQMFLVPGIKKEKDATLDLPDWWYDSNIQGKIVVDDLLVGEQAWQHCQGDFRAIGDGTHLVVPFACQAGGGTVHAELLFRRQQAADDLSINLQIQDIAVEEILAEVGVHNLTGTATGEVKVALENGVQTDVTSRSWQGEGTLKLTDGQFAGVNLWPVTTTENMEEDAKEHPVSTPYDRIESRFRVENSILQFDDLKVFQGVKSLSGHGTLSLSRSILDLEVQRSDGNYVLAGPLAEPELYPMTDERLPEIRGHQPQQADAQTLVDAKLPSPAEEDVKGLVGKPLIAPEVVAERFGLQPELILSQKRKKKLPVGSGIIKIHPLQEESTR